jgi:hypothetical protein
VSVTKNTLVLTDQNRLGYSKKVYINGEISVNCLRDWDAYTRAKARGRRRLHLVDGHSSHYSRAFLQYAREHNIEVIGYPAHSTHIYQGLDVAIFGKFKTTWSEVRDRYERQGMVITKSNFLAVYAEAHLETLTEANIKAAFRKTGVIPFNRDVCCHSRDDGSEPRVIIAWCAPNPSVEPRQSNGGDDHRLHGPSAAVDDANGRGLTSYGLCLVFYRSILHANSC